MIGVMYPGAGKDWQALKRSNRALQSVNELRLQATEQAHHVAVGACFPLYCVWGGMRSRVCVCVYV